MDLEPQRRPWVKLSPTFWLSPGRRFRSGCARTGGNGCLLVLLVVLVILALWVLRPVIDHISTLLGDHPAPVAGSPFDTVAPPLPASSGSPAIDRIAQRGKLIVAIQETPGLAQRAPGSSNYTGFEIALLELIARDLGADPTATDFKPLAGSSRTAALGRGEADLVLGGYELTSQRRTEVSIAGPYLVHPLRLAVPVSSPVSDLDSLDQAEVCAPADSSAAAALTGLGQRLQTQATLAACTRLLGDRIKAIAGDQAALTTVLTKAPGTLRLVGEPLGFTEYGIGLPPGDQVLRDRINAVLRNAINDGTWARSYAEYLGTPVPSPPVPR
jgi:glutamate transport system substrate-binding protein